MLKPALIITIVSSILLAGCQHQTAPAPAPAPDHLLQIPPRDVLDISDVQHVKDTKLEIRLPFSYVRQDSGIFRKTAKAYVQVWPSDTPGFDLVKARLEADFAHQALYDHQSVAIGGWDGLVSYMSDSTRGLEHIHVYFGDHATYYKAEGVFPAGDGAERDTIMASLFSLATDEGAGHSFHHSLATDRSGWYYNGAAGETFYYSTKSDNHQYNNLAQDQFMVIQFRPAKGPFTSIRNLDALLRGFRIAGMNFPEYTIAPTRIGAMDAVAVSTDATYRNKPCSFYAALTGTKAHPLFFVGWVFNNRDLFDSMRKVASTLKVQ